MNFEPIDFSLELDSEGYPTEETLLKIKECSYSQLPSLLLEIKKIWAYNSFYITDDPPEEFPKDSLLPSCYKGKWLRLATVGWSGNESIISYLEENVFSKFFWQMSMRGGLHIYKIPNV